ncbi:MAG: nickel-type superoxide dismutase maturation protease [Myxococcota bacterium]
MGRTLVGRTLVGRTLVGCTLVVRALVKRVARGWCYAVAGDSMRPTLGPGDVVAVRKRGRAPRVGDVVVVRDPERSGKVLVKRVRSLGRATVAVGSDDPAAGRDSRHFGSLPRSAILGRVVVVLSRDGRLRCV